jgi:hypothetical protein
MPKKINIDIDFSSDNTLLAISCHKKDYWMAYNVNEALKFSFRRINDLPFYDQGLDKLLTYSLFHYCDSDSQLSYYLISNFNSEGKLFRAHKTTDFFILVHGRVTEEAIQELLNRIKSIKGVLTAFHPNINKFKDFSLFLSDLELHMVDVLKG